MSAEGKESWRTVAELMGLVGVVGSLLFVGLEIRQSTQVAQAEAYRGFTDLVAEWYFVSVADEELALALRNVSLEGGRRDDLTDAQKWRVGSMVLVLVRSMEGLYYQVGAGVLPEEALALHSEPIYSTPYMADLWPVIRSQLRPEFAAYFEERFGVSAEAPAEG